MYVSNLNKNINIYFSFSHTTVINLHIYSKKAMLIFLIKKKHNKKDKITVICSNFKKSWFQNISFFNVFQNLPKYIRIMQNLANKYRRICQNMSNCLKNGLKIYISKSR